MELPKFSLSSLKDRVASSLATQKKPAEKKPSKKPQDQSSKPRQQDKKRSNDQRPSNRDSRGNGDRNGRDFGSSRGGRDFGSSRGGRDFGSSRGGRDFGSSRGGRDFASSRGGRDGSSRGGRDFGSSRGGRGGFSRGGREGSSRGGRDSGYSRDRDQGSYNDRNNKSNGDFNNNRFDSLPSSRPAESKPAETQEEVLRREALELGASEEDLKLLQGVEEGDESEQEFGDENKYDGDLTKDLSAFMKGIGFSGELPVVDDKVAEEEEGVDESSEEEEGVSEKEEEEEEEEEDEEEQEQEQEQESESEPEISEPEPAKKKVESSETSTTTTAPTEQKKSNKDKINNLSNVITDKLLIPARNDWYDIELPFKSHRSAVLTAAQIDELYAKGKQIVENENSVYYDEFNKSSSQKKFLQQILTSGTLNDKVSALTLLIQEAPLHNLKALNNLFGMCSKKSRTAALQCINAVFDLFVNGMLPSERKLRYFKKQPTLSMDSSDLELGLFYFEDYLKTFYFQFIGILERLSHDSIVYVRTKVVGYIFELLKAKPEQESNLLRLGVNKLGDIDNKVSSKASYQILLLEQQHPAMKQIIVEAVVDILFRKNNEYHAIYYSILTLNQTILIKKEEQLANKLVNAYFAIFEKLLIKTDDQNKGTLQATKYNQGRTKRNTKKGKKGGESVKDERSEEEIIEEKNHRLFAAILTGLNRSFPFSNLPKKTFEDHLDTLYKITHSTNFNTSVQALLLIHNIVISHNIEGAVRDRYYRTLYESLLDSRVLNSSKQGIYLNLIYKSLKSDTDKVRLFSFIKRITQICLGWLNIGTVTGMIYLLIELEKTSPEIRNLFLNTPMDDLLNKEDEEKEANVEEGEDGKDNKTEVRVYDPRKRDPRFTNADKSSLWEINQFVNHYHPTVALYATSFLNGETANEDGSPMSKPDLGLFSLSHFLDRFVYKNFKKKAITRGNSIMQPLGGSQTGSLLVRATGDAMTKEMPVNAEDWLSKKVNDIKAEDKFFYTYFINKQEKLNRSNIDKELEGKAKNGDDDEGSDIDEDDVWNALVKSNPEVEGGEEDYDDEMSDLDMEDFGDEEDEESEIDLGDDEEEEEGENDFSGFNEGEGDDDDEVKLITLDDLDDEEELDEEEEDQDDDDDEEIDQEIDEDSEDDDELNGLLQGGSDDDEYDSDEVDFTKFDDEELGDESDEEIEEEVTNKKRPRSEKKDTKSNKKKKPALPLFAAAEDYSKYLESSDEE